MLYEVITDPTYLPNGQIMFTSTRSGIVDEYERRDSPLLRVADRDANGRLVNVRQISFNQSHDTNPIVHSSGKIFYSRWEHLGNPNKFPLFVINPDGTRITSYNVCYTKLLRKRALIPFSRCSSGQE